MTDAGSGRRSRPPGAVLRRLGTVRQSAGGRVLVFDDERCPGCRCAAAWSPPTLATDRPEGARVVVQAPARAVAARAAWVFGPPLAAPAVAVLALPQAAGDWAGAAALAAGLLGVLLVALVQRRRSVPDASADLSPCTLSGPGDGA